MATFRAAAGTVALLALSACVDVDRNASAGEAMVFQPPRRVASAPGVEVFFVRGNLYRLASNGPGAGTMVTASLTPMFKNAATPNVEDATTAVEMMSTDAEVRCRRGVVEARNHRVDAADNEQTWTFFGECT